MLKSKFVRGVVGAVACSLTLSSAAQAGELILNGGFENLSNGADKQLNYVGSQSSTRGTKADYWTSGSGANIGLNYVFSPGTNSAQGQYGAFSLWDNSNGAASNTWEGYGPSGNDGKSGNFIVADGDSRYSAAISQSVAGLVIGQQYTLTFDWAAGQQEGFSGPTEQLSWRVTFGNEGYSTAELTNVSHGFKDWREATMTFTAKAETQTLSFLAWGLPNTGNGIPPFLLLDNVSMNAVPEPTSVALMGLGIVGVIALKRRKTSAA